MPPKNLDKAIAAKLAERKREREQRDQQAQQSAGIEPESKREKTARLNDLYRKIQKQKESREKKEKESRELEAVYERFRKCEGEFKAPTREDVRIAVRAHVLLERLGHTEIVGRLYDERYGVSITHQFDGTGIAAKTKASFWGEGKQTPYMDRSMQIINHYCALRVNCGAGFNPYESNILGDSGSKRKGRVLAYHELPCPVQTAGNTMKVAKYELSLETDVIDLGEEEMGEVEDAYKKGFVMGSAAWIVSHRWVKALLIGGEREYKEENVRSHPLDDGPTSLIWCVDWASDNHVALHVCVTCYSDSIFEGKILPHVVRCEIHCWNIVAEETHQATIANCKMTSREWSEVFWRAANSLRRNYQKIVELLAQADLNIVEVDHEFRDSAEYKKFQRLLKYLTLGEDASIAQDVFEVGRTLCWMGEEVGTLYVIADEVGGDGGEGGGAALGAEGI